MHVERIHDIRRHLIEMDTTTRSSRPVVGVCNAKVTRLLSFVVIALALVVSVAACLLAVWGYAETEIAWRSLASLGIVSVAVAVFVALNEGFGPMIHGS
jgi:hypothetical protein